MKCIQLCLIGLSLAFLSSCGVTRAVWENASHQELASESIHSKYYDAKAEEMYFAGNEHQYRIKKSAQKLNALMESELMQYCSFERSKSKVYLHKNEVSLRGYIGLRFDLRSLDEKRREQVVHEYGLSRVQGEEFRYAKSFTIKGKVDTAGDVIDEDYTLLPAVCRVRVYRDRNKCGLFLANTGRLAITPITVTLDTAAGVALGIVVIPLVVVLLAGT